MSLQSGSYVSKMLLPWRRKWGVRKWTYVVVRKKFRAENDVFSVVRFWIGEEVECYGGDVGGGDSGEFAFAGGGVDLALVADAWEVLAFGEVF
jgi:hypothetical protein